MSFKDMNLHNFEVSALNLNASAFGLTSASATNEVKDEWLCDALVAVAEVIDTRGMERGYLIYILVMLAVGIIENDEYEIDELVDQVRRELTFQFGE